MSCRWLAALAAILTVGCSSLTGLTGAHTVFPPGWGDEPAQGKGSESVK